ncbi:hypothetical protein I4U23_004603 [Adineta vaga]|nr:hypothetical protein I4U23_004603 [Adineta vaga]
MAQRNTSGGTRTITEDNMRQKFKTLVLKLKQGASPARDTAAMSNDELDAYIDQMLHDIHVMLVDKTVDLRTRIKQARPSPDDPQYNAKMQAYLNLLKIVEPLFKEMQNSFGEVLDHFHQFINDVWKDVTKNKGKNTDAILDRYTQQINKCMNNKWGQYFKEIEGRIAEIKRIHA